MSLRLGFIGCGNMASAIISGVVRSGYAPSDEIIISEPTAEGRDRAKTALEVHVTDSNAYVLSQARTVFICVKPQVLDQVLDDIKDVIEDHQLLITIVAGIPISYYESRFGINKHIKIVRLMPNTPSLVGDGMTAVCANPLVTQGDLQEVLSTVRSFGDAEVVSEHLFDTVTAVSGSSPAYIFMLIEAMADAAVAGGMPRVQAYRFAAQAVRGSAQLVLASGRHPADLKDMVCSPAGTTIAAVKVLEEKGFRSAVMDAMEACRSRSEELQRH